MPVITEAGQEAVVTAWMIDEGQRVAVDQLLAEVQAEKVAEEVRAPADGVGQNLVPINHPVPQGGPICVIEEVDARGTEPTEAAEPAEARPAVAPPTSRVKASPAARRLAGELGVELDELTGSGPEGRITEADVRAAAGPPGEEPVELTGLRAVIARNMRRSHAETAAVTLTTTVDVSDTLPHEITAWVVKAAARALTEHPGLSGRREGDRFFPAPVPHIALAIQTEEGLVAPVVREPATRSLEEIADQIEDLAERSRARRLEAGDFEGGTFTVTNLGPYGVDAFTPIVNPPQVAILGVGTVRTVPGFAGDRVISRSHLTLSLTFDHAFVDGAPAAAFLARIRELLEAGVE